MPTTEMEKVADVLGLDETQDLPQTTEKMLDALAQIREQKAEREARYLEGIEGIIPTEVQEKLNLAEKEYQDDVMGLDETAKGLEASIRREVLSEGQTAKGASLMAVWNKGRTSWDTKGLAGYVVAHPEIEVFRKDGAPSVSFRSR